VFDAASLVTFVVAGLLLNITPGPDVLYIVGRSLAQGRTAGVVSALGIATGSLVHVAGATPSVKALLAATPMDYDAVRYAGAAYLIWLGVRALRSRDAALTIDQTGTFSPAAIFRQGAITNILNPKVALFFLAFLPQFTDPARGSVALQAAVLGLIFIANGLLVCVAYALGASALGAWLRTRYDVHTWMNRAMGALFVGLGVRLALGARR
jgi:threonine/homoserine/homoserine lactone efflux protein